MTPTSLLRFLVWLVILGTSAVQESGADPKIFFANVDSVRFIEIDNFSEQEVVISGLTETRALALYVREGWLFWSEYGDPSTISRLRLTTGSTKEVILRDLGEVEEIAVEWETGLLYWTDYMRETVDVARIDGTHRKTLFRETIANPRAIAVDARSGFMFWSERGWDYPKIERATLAGTDRRVLVDGYDSPYFVQTLINSLAIDFNSDLLYWVDANNDIVEHIRLDGSGRTELKLFTSVNLYPFSLTMYKDMLYASDLRSRSIERVNVTTRERYRNMGWLTAMRTYGIALNDSSREPQGMTDCKTNGNCSQLCLLTPSGGVCACSNGYELLSDNKTCNASAPTTKPPVPVICTKCRKRHYQIRRTKQLETTVVESPFVIQDQEPSVLMTSTNESPERPNISSTSAHESEVDISAMDSVIETEDQAETSLWIDETELQHEKRETLNNAIAKLTEGRYSPIASTLNTSWDDVSVTQQKYYQRKMKEVIQAALSVVVPGQEEYMWNCLRDERVIADVSEEPPAKRKRIDTGLVQTLISAHNDAENWQTKRQILSLFVNDFSKTELQEMIPGLSKWRIDQARCHATDVGEGQPIHDKPIFRARLDPVKTDHFVDYISRPCFLQDVAYGTRKLKLDSGGHAVIPAVIRTLIPSRIIAQYQAYCREIGFDPASERTLFRILEVCSASMQKSLHGLDYITTDGVQAFDSLEDMVTTLKVAKAVTVNWEKEVKQELSDAKRYLKADFRLHVSKDERCADHCTMYALSDPNDPPFKGTCGHVHDIPCDACRGIETVIKQIGAEIEGAFNEDVDFLTKRKLQFEHGKAQEAICAWKAHSLRAVNQDLAKQDVLSALDGGSCLIVMDWAMKFLPLYYREQMRDFFGKRGKSWHVSCVIEKEEDSYSVQCFSHLFEECKQDWFAVASIVENLLEILKREKPFISEVFLRSDNGACYHNAALLLALPAIGSRTGIRIRRYDFSEAQAGKDICDRKIAPMKAHIRRYVNEKHDVATAAKMKAALESHGGVRGSRVAVAAVNLANETGGTNKIKGISKLNNFEFTEEGIRIWSAYQIGPGKLVSYEGMKPQGKTGLKLLQPFGAIPQAQGIFNIRPTYKERSAKNQVFFCETPGCVVTFENENEAQNHMDTGVHKLVLERETLYDSVRRKWAQHVTEIASRTTLSVPTTSTRAPGTNNGNEAPTSQGWALKGQKTATKTSENVKRFLIAKFNEGLSGQKANPSEVAKEMQEAKDSNGSPVFLPEDWKTARQIRSFFSRLSALKKSSHVNAVTLRDEENVDEEDLRSWEGRLEAESIRKEVYSAVNLQHPVYSEGHNICLMAKERKLKNLKVQDLKNICTNLSLTTTGNQQRKVTFINAIDELVNSCSCSNLL